MRWPRLTVVFLATTALLTSPLVFAGERQHSFVRTPELIKWTDAYEEYSAGARERGVESQAFMSYVQGVVDNSYLLPAYTLASSVSDKEVFDSVSKWVRANGSALGSGPAWQAVMQALSAKFPFDQKLQDSGNFRQRMKDLTTLRREMNAYSQARRANATLGVDAVAFVFYVLGTVDFIDVGVLFRMPKDISDTDICDALSNWMATHPSEDGPGVVSGLASIYPPQ